MVIRVVNPHLQFDDAKTIHARIAHLAQTRTIVLAVPHVQGQLK